jgi:hypothetical protein
VFTLGYDRNFALGVFLFSGEKNTDDDFAAYCDSIEWIKATLREKPGALAPCGIAVADPGNPPPNAHWRRGIAAVSATGFPRRTRYAMVSRSPLVRGVVTAINWLRPPPYEVMVCSTFAEAVRWMEELRGVRLPLFDALLAEARDRAERGERLPPMIRRPA